MGVHIVFFPYRYWCTRASVFINGGWLEMISQHTEKNPYCMSARETACFRPYSRSCSRCRLLSDPLSHKKTLPLIQVQVFGTRKPAPTEESPKILFFRNVIIISFYPVKCHWNSPPGENACTISRICCCVNIRRFPTFRGGVNRPSFSHLMSVHRLRWTASQRSGVV